MPIRFTPPSPLPVRYIEPLREQYEHIHEAADDGAPWFFDAYFESVEALLAAFNELVALYGLLALEVAINRLDYNAILEPYATQHFEAMRDIAQRARRASAETSLPFPTTVDLNDTTAASNWARDYSAARITAIDDETRAGIQQAVSRSLSGQLSQEEAILHVRQAIGLTPRYEQALLSYRSSLRAQGLPDSQVEQLTAARAFRYRQLRAETIFRTETITAANMGQRLLWDEAVARGDFRPEEYEVYWIVTPDDRLCPWCRAMAGKTIGVVGEQFRGEFQNQLVTMLVPPLHVGCRCTAGLRRRGEP